MSKPKPRRSSSSAAPRDPLQNRFRRLADNTVHFAQWAKGTPRYERYRRIEESWRSLARTEDWLLGRVNPLEFAAPIDGSRASDIAGEGAGNGAPHPTERRPSGAEPSREPNQSFQDTEQPVTAEA